MALLPSKPAVERREATPEVRNIAEVNDQLFTVLRSDTARTILMELYEEPAVASELADRANTSLQNAQYHLDNLTDAGLVEVVGTWYSTKGNEMKVYGPTGDPLTLVIGADEKTETFRRALDEAGEQCSDPSGNESTPHGA